MVTAANIFSQCPLAHALPCHPPLEAKLCDHQTRGTTMACNKGASCLMLQVENLNPKLLHADTEMYKTAKPNADAATFNQLYLQIQGTLNNTSSRSTRISCFDKLLTRRKTEISPLPTMQGSLRNLLSVLSMVAAKRARQPTPQQKNFDCHDRCWTSLLWQLLKYCVHDLWVGFTSSSPEISCVRRTRFGFSYMRYCLHLHKGTPANKHVHT